MKDSSKDRIREVSNTTKGGGKPRQVSVGRGDCWLHRRSGGARLALSVGLVLLIAVAALAQKKDSCVDCHSQMEGPLAEPVGLMSGDIHKSRGLSCADCHGGDASQDDPMGAMDPRKGFIGKLKPKDIPGFCGKCHSNADFIKKFNPALRVDQEREYATSVHGKLLQGGDGNVATCASCHGAHGVRAVNDPLSRVYALNVAETCAQCHAKGDYMKSYKIAFDQYDKYKLSVHSKALYERQDLSAPTCNDCHGNHGAAPPGVASVANVCGQCHIRQSSLFSASAHKPVFDAMQVGECIQCHRNHDIFAPSDEMIGVDEASVCTTCHNEGDSGHAAAAAMRARLDELGASIQNALDILNRAERAGMEVSRPKFELTEARDGLTHARVLIHSASLDEIDKVIAPAMAVAGKSHDAGRAALSELSFRRKGLSVSLFFILFLAAVIYLKIRQIERRASQA
ncbi:MAG TPA: cytochrome c3 family protein [Blastocatellia bacterium]|nr:cytochrome c3 family protein [Blastocatellia bacterium]